MSERGMSRRDFLKGIMAAGAVGAFAPGCNVELGDGYSYHPEKAEKLSNPKFEFEKGYESTLSEVQKNYICEAVKKEINTFEPVYRQNLAVVEIWDPEHPDMEDREGDFNDFTDRIRLRGPLKGDERFGESPNSIDLALFLSSLPGLVAHEVGHSVHSMKGVKQKFVDQGPTLYHAYGLGEPGFPGKSPEKEDAAEGFKFYRTNKYIFPLFFFEENPKNRLKYESLRDETFGGRDYAFDPFAAASIIKQLIQKKIEGSQPALLTEQVEKQISDRLEKAYANLSSGEKDPRFEAFFKYLLLYLSEKGGDRTSILKKYNDAVDAARAVQWDVLLANSNAAAGLCLTNSFNRNRDERRGEEGVRESLDLIDEKYKKAFASGHLSLPFELYYREEYARVLISHGDKTTAAKVLSKNLALAETTSVDRANKILSA